MKEAYSAQGIADALQQAVRTVSRRAEREGWPHRKREGKGGGREYLLADLPNDIREALAKVVASEAASAGRKEALQLTLNESLNARVCSAARQDGLSRFAKMDGQARGRAEARAALVAACREFVRSGGFAARAGRELFAHQYNAGVIQVDVDIREQLPSVCANSIRNWEKSLETEGVARLAGNYGQHRRGSGVIDSTPELREFVLAMLVEHPHVDAKHISRAIAARFPDQKLRVSMRNLQRWLKAWKDANRQLHTAMTNPDAWRSRYQAAGGNASASILQLNQRWEVDSTKGDVMLADGRHVILGCIDVYSRRMKLHVSRSSSAAGVLSLLRRCLLDWGIPREIGTDNGSDYVSRQVRTVLTSLGIHQDIAPPFTPEHKPFIERSFGTFSHDLLELCAGFVGHNVAERKDIESRRSFAQRLAKGTGEPLELLMSPDELQSFCDRWTDEIYAHDAHGGLNRQTPWQVASSWTGAVHRIADERALDVLLLPFGGDGLRQVRKKGLRLDGNWYDHADLGGHEGETVRVLLDEADIGSAYVFRAGDSGEWEWLCKAICPEIAGVSRRDVAVARKRKQKAVIAEQKRELKQIARQTKTKDIVHEIFEERAVEAGKLTRLPQQQSIPHETEALRQAGIAARADEFDLERAATLTPEERAEARASVQPAKVLPMPETPRAMYRRWLEVDKAVKAGCEISEQDRFWWESFQQTSAYRAERKMVELFGAEAAM